jgi:hypothetical protein
VVMPTAGSPMSWSQDRVVPGAARAGSHHLARGTNRDAALSGPGYLGEHLISGDLSFHLDHEEVS